MLILSVTAAVVLAIVWNMLVSPWVFSRTSEFLTKAQSGQPIVRSLENFRRQNGAYPKSLADLAPNYLPEVSKLHGGSHFEFSGWDYLPVTNGAAGSYSLRFHLGKGGVEYEPPRWFGNDEGLRTVILSHD